MEPKKIYIRKVPDSDRDYGFAIAAHLADGTIIAGHFCSDLEFARSDMGLTSDRKHDIYRENFPEGYELVDELDAPTSL